MQNLAAQENKVFSYETLVTATNKFSILNKLGEGGFGPVFKVIQFSIFNEFSCLSWLRLNYLKEKT